MNEIERAARAKELLESNTFKSVHAEVRNEIIGALESVAFDDIEKQHELVLSLQLHRRLKTKLERWVDDGKLEEKKAEQDSWVEKIRQRYKRA
jgi:hypothetical protein